MADEAEQLRHELADCLARHAEALRLALQEALAEPIALEDGRCLQIELDPDSFRIVLCDAEAELMPDDWLRDGLPDDWITRADEESINWDALLSDALLPWLAACWRAEGGPRQSTPAYAFWHGYAPRYDLEVDRWRPLDEAFSEADAPGA